MEQMCIRDSILIEYLLENGYLEIGKTELIYKFDGKTVIIMLEGNRREYQYRVGIGEGDYDGKQEVEAFGDKYGRLRDAAVDAERKMCIRDRVRQIKCLLIKK